jgi:hypothetical protein
VLVVLKVVAVDILLDVVDCVVTVIVVLEEVVAEAAVVVVVVGGGVSDLDAIVFLLFVDVGTKVIGMGGVMATSLFPQSSKK